MKLKWLRSYLPPEQSLKRIWTFLINQLWNSQELRVYQVQNKSGQVEWRVYDPVTGYRATFGTEEDVRVWIEDSYYPHTRRRLR